MENTKKKKSIINAGLKYALGGAGMSMPNNLIMGYLAFFWTDFFDLHPFTVAGLMLVSRIVDAVTDPIMGIIADRTKTRFGKYRPWVIFCAPLEGLVIFSLFCAPELPEAGRIIYAYVTYIGYSLTSTMVTIPYNSIMPLLTKDPYERTVVNSMKSVVLQTGRMLITVMALPLATWFGGGKQGWAYVGGITGIIVTALYWIVAMGTKPYDVVTEVKKEEKHNLSGEIAHVLKTKPLLCLMGSYGLILTSNSVFNSVNLYYFKYVLENESLVPFIVAVNMGANVLAAMILPKIVKRYGAKKAYWFGSLICIFSFAPLMFIMKPGTNLLVVLMILFGFMSSLPECLAWCMIPECIDYAEWKYNLTGANGLVYSLLNFMTKCGMAIGSSATTFFLGLAGFAANQAQTEQVLKVIIALKFGVPIAVYVLSILIMHFYEITPEKYTQISSELNERKRQNAQVL